MGYTTTIAIATITLIIISSIIALYIFTPQFKHILEGLQDVTQPLLTTYDISNTNIQYHPSYMDTNIDASGGFALPIYYKPNSSIYPHKQYVPNYADTIYMSSLTGLSNVAQYYDVSANR
jgi:hypothetical protein